MTGNPRIREPQGDLLWLALRGLAHPASLVALAALVWNDHWWKGVGPGIVTGKLSDVAGLFLFPLLVLALTGAVWRRPRRVIGVARWVYLGTGLWWIAAKTVPTVHGATVALAGAALGPVTVVFDPTDAAAVVALWPSWVLVKRLRTASPTTLGRALQPAALLGVVLATGATSPPRGIYEVQLVRPNEDGGLDAYVVDRYRDTPTHVWSSRDGKTWRHSREVPAENTPEANVREGGDKAAGLRRAGPYEAQRRRIVRWGDESVVFDLSQRAEFVSMRAGHRDWWLGGIVELPGRPGTFVAWFTTEGVVVIDEAGRWSRHEVAGFAPHEPRVPLAAATRTLIEDQGGLLVLLALMALTVVSVPSAARLESGLEPARAAVVGGRQSLLGPRLLDPADVLVLSAVSLVASGFVLGAWSTYVPGARGSLQVDWAFFMACLVAGCCLTLIGLRWWRRKQRTYELVPYEVAQVVAVAASCLVLWNAGVIVRWSSVCLGIVLSMTLALYVRVRRIRLLRCGR